MRNPRPSGAALAALIVTLGCSTLDDAGSIDLPAAPDHVRLAGGGTLEGTVESTDAERIVFHVAGEAAPRTLPRTDLDLLSWVRARASDGALTAEERLDLARLAMGAGQFEAAALEAARAAALDPSLEEEASSALARGREEYAARLAQESDRALTAGDRRVARRLAGRVLTAFPDTGAAAAAQETIEQLHADIGEVGPPAGGDEALRLVSTPQADRRLEEAERFLERAEKRNLAALQRSGSSARRSFENAISDYEKALDLLDRVIGDDESSVDQRLRAQRTREEAVGDAVDVHVELASFYLHRGSYPQSQEIAAEALELDPESERARRMVDRADFVAAEAGRVRRLGRKQGKNYRVDPASG